MSKDRFPTTTFESGGLRLRLVSPPSDLVPYVSGYYRTEVADGVVVEDWLPPEEGNLRTGRASTYLAAIGGEPLVEVPPAVLSGPTDRGTQLRIGGGKFWGVGLSPAGWARIIRKPASEMANSFRDVWQTDTDPSLRSMLDRLREDGDDIDASAQLITETLRVLLGKRPPSESTVHAVHLGIISPEMTGAAELAAMAGLTPRTFERFCNRHFGFPPSALLRRQRFLRSLARYMLDPTMRWINSLDTHYWDQAHFIRDFRAVMNMTPSEYGERPHPIIGAAVQVTRASSGVAFQALYHPDQSRESETGL
ncbi:MAG: helix-turn-helix domain-containing protein [Erythrobacter sp.]